MIHLQNTQEQIDEQKQHYVELQEDIPDELREKIDKFEIVKGILHVSNTVNEMLGSCEDCVNMCLLCVCYKTVSIFTTRQVSEQLDMLTSSSKFIYITHICNNTEVYSVYASFRTNLIAASRSYWT